jgi:hypothetical protein
LLSADTLSRLQAVRLNRADRYEKTSRNLMRLAWSIEGAAVLIGLSIAFSRVHDANQLGTESVSFWGAIQLMGGFIIVSMGELTKIPLSMLLVNVRVVFKPFVLLVVCFISAITFETVFLSLERGYNFQKSDIHGYRDQLRAVRERLDTEAERAEIDRIEGQIRAEQANRDVLESYHASNLASIEAKYANDGDAAKPDGYANAEQVVLELKAELSKLAEDYEAKRLSLMKAAEADAAVYDDNGALAGAGGDTTSPELTALDRSIELLEARKKSLQDELDDKLKKIQENYEKKRNEFQKAQDSARDRGDEQEVARYQGYIERLAPRTESEEVESALNPQIEDINDKIIKAISDREEIALRDARAKGSVFSKAESERLKSWDDARKAVSQELDELRSDMDGRRDTLTSRLAQAQLRLDRLNAEWQTDRDVVAQSSAASKKQERADETAQYQALQEAKNVIIEDLRASQLRLSQEIGTVEKSAPELQQEIGEKQRLLCDALLGNQIFRISTRFDASGLFGAERSPEEAALVGKADADCPTQVHVDEANADRVAFIWFGSIALLAATAGAATAITAQGFLRMAETLRWQPPSELSKSRSKLLGSLRLALVKWRWRRVKTIEVERIKEVQVEVIKPFETIREVENIIRELVPVPVFVPTGGNVEAEMAKVRSNYEEMNRLAREAAIPPQTTIYQDEVPSTPEKTAIVQTVTEELVTPEGDDKANLEPAAAAERAEEEENTQSKEDATGSVKENGKGSTNTTVETTA